MRDQMMNWKDIDYFVVDPDASDLAIATGIADYILQTGPCCCHYLQIFHDVRKRGGFSRDDHWGEPCPVPYDWSRKNLVGIKVTDREAARRWAIKAMLLGYTVFYLQRRDWVSVSPGNIARVRQRVREYHATDARQAAWQAERRAAAEAVA